MANILLALHSGVREPARPTMVDALRLAVRTDRTGCGDDVTRVACPRAPARKRPRWCAVLRISRQYRGNLYIFHRCKTCESFRARRLRVLRSARLGRATLWVPGPPPPWFASITLSISGSAEDTGTARSPLTLPTRTATTCRCTALCLSPACRRCRHELCCAAAATPPHARPHASGVAREAARREGRRDASREAATPRARRIGRRRP